MPVQINIPAAASPAAGVVVLSMIVLPVLLSFVYLGSASWTILPPTMVMSGLMSLISSAGTVR